MGRKSRWWRIAVVLFAVSSLGWAQEPDLVPPPAAEARNANANGNADENVDILARGPVHEAFAEQVSPDPTPGMTVPKAPPEPDRRGAAGLEAGGGRCGLDPRLLVLGRRPWRLRVGQWRVAARAARSPLGSRLLAGGGRRDSSGLRASGDRRPSTELEYAETPPESLEAGPSSPAPADGPLLDPGELGLRYAHYRWRPATGIRIATTGRG